MPAQLSAPEAPYAWRTIQPVGAAGRAGFAVFQNNARGVHRKLSGPWRTLADAERSCAWYDAFFARLAESFQAALRTLEAMPPEARAAALARMHPVPPADA